MVLDTGFSMTFGGVELMQWIDGVQTVTRNVGQNRTAQLLKIGHTDGQLYQYTTAAAGTISVAALILYTPNRRALAEALTTNNPQQLILGDEPGVYYNAIADGQTTLSEAYQSNIVTITFTVPDALAHAVKTSNTTGTTSAEVTLTNAGSAPTAPLLTATCQSDNGLVAWTNDQGGVLQFGSVDEVDGITQQKSERVFWAAFSQDGKDPTLTLNQAVRTYVTHFSGTPNVMDGSWKYTKIGQGTGIEPVYPATAKAWAGPAYQGALPKNSAGSNTGAIKMACRFAITATTKELGRLEFVLGSDTGVAALASTIRSSTAKKDEVIWEGWANGKIVVKETLNRKKFTNGNWVTTISRIGSKITFTLAKSAKVNADNSTSVNSSASLTKSLTLDYMASTPMTTVNIWAAQYQAFAPVAWNISDVMVTWANVSYWTDEPNRFAAGDVVMADVANKKVYLNGVPDPTLQTVGNMWDSFLLQPGQNSIQCLVSDWADPADVAIDWREAYY